MSEYVLEVGVPLPKNTRPPRSKYPFHLLQPGYSFLVTDEKGMRNVGAALTRWKKATGEDRVVTRHVVETDADGETVNGVRVYMLENAPGSEAAAEAEEPEGELDEPI